MTKPMTDPKAIASEALRLAGAASPRPWKRTGHSVDFNYSKWPPTARDVINTAEFLCFAANNIELLARRVLELERKVWMLEGPSAEFDCCGGTDEWPPVHTADCGG